MERNRRIKMRALFSTLFIFLTGFIFGQEPDKVEMADTMRSNGKIYVVIAVLAIVLLMLFIYLISIESKVKKLEEKLNKK